MTDDEKHKLLFDIRRSARYHDRRRAFFQRMHQITGVLTILLAGGVLFELAGTGETSLWLKLIGVVAAVFSSVDIVVGYAASENLHATLRQRFCDLEVSVIAGNGTINSYMADRVLIEQEEPPVYRALDLLCYNEQLISDGYSRANKDDSAHFSNLEWYQAFTANLYRWPDIADGAS